jgi:hypothetical protein
VPLGAVRYSGDDLPGWTCSFGSWKHYTRQLDSHPLSSINSFQRKQAISAEIDCFAHLFPDSQLAKLVARRPGPRAEPPSHPTATGGAHAAICRPRGGIAKQNL